MQRSESRQRQHSSHARTKNSFELPKINRTTVTITKHKNSLNNKQNSYFMPPSTNESRLNFSYVEKVRWVVEEIDYSELNEKQIDNQYARLRKQLTEINLDVAKSLQKMNLKSIKRQKISEPDSMKTLQLRNREIDNNLAIIQRLTKQYQGLQKRACAISSDTKQNIQTEIEESKKKIVQLRAKIKELKLRNKSIGDSIVNTDSIYDEIKRLEMEKEVQERKKHKLEQKSDKVLDQIATSQLKLEQIYDDFTIAENYFEQYHGKQQKSDFQKQMERKLMQAKHALQVVNKKFQSSSNSKQQKYHILLKNLENQVQKIGQAQKKTSYIELQIIQKKKMIEELEELLKQRQIEQQKVLIQETAFFTEFEENTEKHSEGETENIAKNDKNSSNMIQQEKYEEQQFEQVKEDLEEVKNMEMKKSDSNQQFVEENKVVSNGTVNNIRLSTNGPQLEEEYNDVIMDLEANSDLDEKFKYGKNSKKNFNRRYQNKTRNTHPQNDYETELGQNLSQNSMEVDEVDESDQEIIQFKSKISEQKRKSQKSNSFKVDLTLDVVHENLNSISKQKTDKEIDEQLE